VLLCVCHWYLFGVDERERKRVCMCQHIPPSLLMHVCVSVSMPLWMCVCVWLCYCVCVCVWERECPRALHSKESTRIVQNQFRLFIGISQSHSIEWFISKLHTLPLNGIKFIEITVYTQRYAKLKSSTKMTLPHSGFTIFSKYFRKYYLVFI
jgi:hypothetical protein